MELKQLPDGKLRYDNGYGFVICSTTSVPEDFKGEVKVEDSRDRIKFLIKPDGGEWIVLGDEF